jgi:hypothetical protein
MENEDDVERDGVEVYGWVPYEKVAEGEVVAVDDAVDGDVV